MVNMTLPARHCLKTGLGDGKPAMYDALARLASASYAAGLPTGVVGPIPNLSAHAAPWPKATHPLGPSDIVHTAWMKNCGMPPAGMPPPPQWAKAGLAVPQAEEGSSAQQPLQMPFPPRPSPSPS
eukprot:EG_transcript_48051